MYKAYRADRPTVAMQSQDWTLPEPTVDAYTDSLMSEAQGFSDTAVIVISRSGGEGADLPTDMNAVIKGTYNLSEKVSVMPSQYGYTNATYTNNGSYDDFEPGEHFLELSVTEENMVEKVCSTFDKVVVIINANNNLLNGVLRGEWGFVGMVETDYDGSYGYMISDHCVRNGNDLMLGFAMAASNQFTDQSATAVTAMRNACKNILYTIGNSGYYADGDPANAPDKLVGLMRNVDIGIGVVLVLLEILAVMLFLKKKKAA